MPLTRRDFLFGAIATAPVLQWSSVREVARDAIAFKVRGPDADLAAIEHRIRARLGVSAIDTGSGRSVTYRAGERFAMCSTFKFLAVAATLQRVDEKLDRLDRNEPTLNTAIQGDERDTTTPAAMLADMRTILLGDVLSAASRQLLASWLIANTTGGERLRASVPATWRIGDKTGTGLNGATGDIAIMWPPNRKPIIVTTYIVESSASLSDRNAAIRDAGSVVLKALE